MRAGILSISARNFFEQMIFFDIKRHFFMPENVMAGSEVYLPQLAHDSIHQELRDFSRFESTVT
jgi:hypothetical protein